MEGVSFAVCVCAAGGGGGIGPLSGVYVRIFAVGLCGAERDVS